MKKLCILFILLFSSCNTFAKEPFCQSFVVYGQDVKAFTVPEGKKFVMLKVYVDCWDGQWQINKNDELWLIGNHDQTKNYVASFREFPDGLAVLNGNERLTLKKNPNVQYIYYSIVGYFQDISEPVCQSYPNSDINKDCKVNFEDLIFLAREWPDCNLDPGEACIG